MPLIMLIFVLIPIHLGEFRGRREGLLAVHQGSRNRLPTQIPKSRRRKSSRSLFPVKARVYETKVIGAMNASEAMQ